MFKITKNVSNYSFGKGYFDSLFENKLVRSGKVFVALDIYFAKSELRKNLENKLDTEIYICDSSKEPETEQIDSIIAGYKKKFTNLPVAVIGIGGGVALDIAKAVSNMFTNPGKAEDYQGWDLVKEKGIYKIGIPTISGTGAEGSRTCVLLNQKKNLKLGMNSDYTIYDELILDPDLTKTVPKNQYFYTGMDTYIHCVESLRGSNRHALADAYSREALNLCSEVFFGAENMQSEINREKLMVASYLGGAAIANSFVGVVHPFSAGLSVVLGTHHCVANCIVMNHMDEFYPEETLEFQKMVEKQKIEIPKNICKDLSNEEFERLYLSTIIHEKPLTNALGPKFKDILTKEKVIDLFKKM